MNRQVVALACALVLVCAPSHAVAQRTLRLQVDSVLPDSGAPEMSLPGPIWVRVVSVTANPIDSSSCASLGVQFTPLNGGSVAPSLAPAVWSSGKCLAEARWHLAADTGRQFLDVSALRLLASTPELRSNPLLIMVRAVGPSRDLRIRWDHDTRSLSGLTGRTMPRIVASITFARDTTLAPDSAQCSTLAVQFATFGAGSDGNASPSPAPAVWRRGDGNTRPSCVFAFTWRLADEPGDQYLNAIVQQGNAQAPATRSNVQDSALRAVGRYLPEIVFGISGVFEAPDLDSLTVTNATFKGAAGRIALQPVIGAEFPLVISPHLPLDRIRLFAGVSIKNPSRELYAGLSVFPLLVYGPQFESFPIHISAGLRIQRITTVDGGSGCTAGGSTQQSCRVDHWSTRVFISALTSGTAFLSAILRGFGIS